MNIIVTGGSGFIGTNLIDYFLKFGHQVLNYDINPPQKFDHLDFWVKLDICDSSSLHTQLLKDDPDFIIHLAARTDLGEKESILGYSTNIDGVRNVMSAASRLQNLKRIIVASSMLVCRVGYFPINFDDYCPSNLYGESKVLTEQIVKEYNLDWVIVRPTSIWGPWFGVPYRNFFELVMRGMYFNIPTRYASTKTYGFVTNTCSQIYALLFCDGSKVKNKFFYLGDPKPVNIAGWANTIRKVNNQGKLLTLPVQFLKVLALLGDALNQFFQATWFPMNSFRYRNMTNDNVVQDLFRTLDVTETCLQNDFESEIKITIDWLKKNKK